MAPIMQPEKTPARDSFDHVTVNPIGMTDGLKTTPLQDERFDELGMKTNMDILDIKQLKRKLFKKEGTEERIIERTQPRSILAL